MAPRTLGSLDTVSGEPVRNAILLAEVSRNSVYLML